MMHRMWTGYLPNTEHRNEHHVSVHFAAQGIMKAFAYCAQLNYCFPDTAAKLFEIMFKHSLVHLTEIQYNYCFGRKIAVNFLTNRNCKLFSFSYYPHSYPVYSNLKCLVLKTKQAARDNEPSGCCVSTYIAHQLQNALIIIPLITPLSQYIRKNCQVSTF